jgi:hypothetical protein
MVIFHSYVKLPEGMGYGKDMGKIWGWTGMRLAGFHDSWRDSIAMFIYFCYYW